jgi:hypothetical protein
VKSSLDVLERELIRERLKQFLSHAIEKAGGPKALGHKLEKHGFMGREGPYDERTVRAWRAGRRMPSPEIVFGIAMLFEVSLDRYLFGEELHDRLALDVERLREDRDQLMVWILEVRERLGYPPPDQLPAGVTKPGDEPAERLGA